MSVRTEPIGVFTADGDFHMLPGQILPGYTHDRNLDFQVRPGDLNLTDDSDEDRLRDMFWKDQGHA